MSEAEDDVARDVRVGKKTINRRRGRSCAWGARKKRSVCAWPTSSWIRSRVPPAARV